jgi:RNA polymerase sigma factor (TIGR02999 family)
MSELRAGNPDAAGRLVELYYPQLRRLAAVRMRGEDSQHTWQPTVLVNELYLELARIKSLPSGPSGAEVDKDEFFALAAFLMKRLLAQHARPMRKRMETNFSTHTSEPSSGEQSLREIEDMLGRLGTIDANLRAVVEMRVFEGLSREEISERLGCSVRTVARLWDFARHWLRTAMTPGNS